MSELDYWKNRLFLDNSVGFTPYELLVAMQVKTKDELGQMIIDKLNQML